MPKKEKIEEKKLESKSKKHEFYQAVGRRKESTARIRLYPVKSGTIHLKNKDLKAGEIIVNNLPIQNYFSGETMQKLYSEPFRTTNTQDRFVVSAIIAGGGKMGQLGAFIHGISRALVIVDNEKFRPLLRKRGFMTRDPRSKERRKAGFAQKARAKKQSPKR